MRKGTIGCLLHQSPKFYNNVFLFVGLTTLGILIVWFIKLSVNKFQPLSLIYRRGDFVYHPSLGMYINLSAIFLSLQNPEFIPPTPLPDFLLTNVFFSSFAFFEISCKKQFLIKGLCPQLVQKLERISYHIKK